MQEPGLFRTAFSAHPSEGWPQDTGRGRSGRSPNEILSGVLDELDAEGLLRPGTRQGAEVVAWSAVHGFSCLVLDGPLGVLSDSERDAAREVVLRGIESALLVTDS